MIPIVHGTCTLSACRASLPGRGKYRGVGGIRVLGGGKDRAVKRTTKEKEYKIDQTQKRGQRVLSVKQTCF